MHYLLEAKSIQQSNADTIVTFVIDQKKLTKSTEIIDQIDNGSLKKLIQKNPIKNSLLLQYLPNLKFERILIINCDLKDKKELDDRGFIKILSTISQTLTAISAKTVLCCLDDLPVQQRDLAWKVEQFILNLSNALYRFDELKSRKSDAPSLEKIIFHSDDKSAFKPAEKSIEIATAIASGMALTKRLGNLPGNICTPSYIAEQAKELGKADKKFKVSVLEENDMQKLGMNALLSVSRGSKQPAKLITLEYQGSKKTTDKPIVLIGKGITFDAGGISLKPGPGMDEMKFDMCGAASVLGTLKAISELKLPINIVGVIAASENLPGGNASKPGDIVKTMSGQTVEILNTDAEGRLVLCDALTYCERFKPKFVIDVATLTGAIIIGLGNLVSGVMSNDDELANDLINAGNYSFDHVWRLPLWEDYQEGLDSNFADMANISGDRGAGSIMGACFLKKKKKNYRWAHLDIAGTAWRSGKAKGASGRPVALLTHYLLQQSER